MPKHKKKKSKKKRNKSHLKPQRPYHTVNPYLLADNIPEEVRFIKKVFRGKVIEQLKGADDEIIHCEMRVGDAVIMIGQNRDERKPSAMVYIYVKDTDDTYRRALTQGAESLMEPEDQFYGDRNAGVRDPSGNSWWIATVKKKLSEKEIQKRLDERNKKN